MALAPPHAGTITGPASRLFAGWWQSTADGPATVIPDGVADVLWRSGEVPWLAGPDTTPTQVSPAVGSTTIGLTLRPGAAAAVVKGPVTEVTNQRVELDTILAPTVIDRLTQKLEQAASSLQAASLLADVLAGQADQEWAPDPIVEIARSQLSTGEPISVSLSARQHRRRFSDAMGYPPAFYRRICRLDRFSRLATADPAGSLAALAATAGFHDQAHLARDCRALADCTASQLVKRAQPVGRSN